MKGYMNLGWEAKGGRATENSRNKWTNTLRRQKNNISAGDFVSEDWVFTGICMYATEDKCPNLNKPHHVTYPDGAYMLVKVNTIESSIKLPLSKSKYGINYASKYSPVAKVDLLG